MAAMIDRAAGPPPAPGALRGDWRAQLGTWAQLMFAVFSGHRWLLEVAVGPRVMGPNELGWLDRAIAALEGTGLTGPERVDAVVVLIGHVRLIAAQAAASPSQPPVGRQRFLAPMRGVLRAYGDRYPAVAAALASSGRDAADGNALQFGLDCLLDGLAVLIRKRAGTDS